MCINFVTAAGQVIQTKQVETVSIPLKSRRIDLQNIALASKCDFNSISLGQLRETGISFHDNPMSMALINDGEIIAHAKRSRNLFILNLATPGKVMKVSQKVNTHLVDNTSQSTNQTMALRGRDRPTHLIRKNRKIRIWHRRVEHVSNTRVIRASTSLVNGIDLQQAKYNPSEVFIDLDKSEYDTDEDNNPNQSDKQKDADQALTFQTSALDPALETSTINPDLKKLCTTCIASKSTRTVKRHKSMTPANEKLEEVHADLWGPHDPPSRSGNAYAAILICEYTQKTWTLYF